MSFAGALFEKRNNLDELITLPTKVDERSMFQISFRTLRSEHQDSHNPESAPKFTADLQSSVFSKSVNRLDLPHKSTIRALFKAKSVDPKTYSSPSLRFAREPRRISGCHLVPPLQFRPNAEYIFL